MARYDDRTAFVRELEQILTAFNITQTRLASEAGMDRSRVNTYLRERRRPSLSTMVCLDEAVSRILDHKRKFRRRPRAERSS